MLHLQYDWCSWIPNSPPTMRKPPPTKKGEVDMAFILNSLPDRGRSCWHLGAVWALSQFQDNEVRLSKKKNNNMLPLHIHCCFADTCKCFSFQLFLGMYPDEHFIEKPVKKAMETFRQKLDELTKAIKNRNEGKNLPFFYLSPDRIPNSVAL